MRGGTTLRPRDVTTVFGAIVFAMFFSGTKAPDSCGIGIGGIGGASLGSNGMLIISSNGCGVGGTSLRSNGMSIISSDGCTALDAEL